MKRHSAKGLYKRPFGSFGGTLNEVDVPSELPEAHVLKSLNWRVHADGKSREKRPGCVKHDIYYNFAEAIRGIFGYEDDGGNYRDVVCTDKKIHVFDPVGLAWNEVYSQASAVGHPIKPVAYERGRPLVVGYDESLTVEATTSYKLGIVAPTIPPRVSEGDAGAISGAYKYLITFYRSGNYPCESNPSPASGINSLIDGGLEEWLSTTDLEYWTEYKEGGSTINRESTEVHSGTYSARLDVDASNSACYIEQAMVLTPEKKCMIILWYKTAAGKTASIFFRDSVNNVYLDSNGEWQTDWTNIVLPSATDWTKFELEFSAHEDYEDYKLTLSKELAASSSIYFDDCAFYQYDKAVTVSGKKIFLFEIPISSDPKVNARRIYRTKDDGETFYWLDDINDNSTPTYEDNYTDDEISGSDIVSYERYPPPVGDAVEVWDERIWILVKSENRVYYTNTGESEEMGSLNFLNITATESDEVTTLKAFGDNLYIFKSKSFHKVEKIGISYYELSLMPEKIGCDAGGSIAAGDDFMFWKSKKGIEVFNGYKTLKPKLSRYVKRTLASVNKNYLDKIVGEINEAEDEYWLSVPTGTATEPDIVTVLKIVDGEFTLYEFAYNLTAFFNSKDGDEEMIFVSGSSDSELLDQGSGYDDNGTQIKASFMSKRFPVCGEKEVWNIVRRLIPHYIATGGKTIILNIYKDFKKYPFAAFELKSVSLDDDSQIRSESIRRLNISAKCTHICLEFVNEDKIEGECRVITVDGYFKKRAMKRDITGE